MTNEVFMYFKMGVAVKILFSCYGPNVKLSIQHNLYIRPITTEWPILFHFFKYYSHMGGVCVCVCDWIGRSVAVHVLYGVLTAILACCEQTHASVYSLMVVIVVILTFVQPATPNPLLA